MFAWTLIVLDLVMPEMSGLELLRRIKENPRLREIPIYVLTGKELTDAEAEFLERQNCPCFQKSSRWGPELVAQLDWRSTSRLSVHEENPDCRRQSRQQ